jgi:hypothetical protein
VTELGDQQQAHEPPLASRRTVLRAAGLLALTGTGAAGLASCSAEAQSGPPSATSAAATTSPPASPSPTGDATSPKPSASQAKAPSGPSVATSKVPVGGGVILENADYVITQPSKGKYKASARSALTRDARSHPSKTVSFTATVTAASTRSRMALSPGRRLPSRLPKPRRRSSTARFT